MCHLVAAAKKLVADTAGATMVEYGLLLALIVIVCISVMQILGNRSKDGESVSYRLDSPLWDDPTPLRKRP
jgi:Flp pilus assembly pilin Flp